MRLFETDFLRIRYQHKQIPKKPFNILCAVIILLKYCFGICLCSILIPLLHVSNLLQNGHFPVFSDFLAAIVVVVVDINSANVGTPRLRVEQIFNLTIRTKVLM